MLRYVSRRIKDSVERTCILLETRRCPWTLGNEAIVDRQSSKHQVEHNNHFQLHLHQQQSPNVIFEFGFGPPKPTNRFNDVKVGDVKIGRKNVCKFQRKQANAATSPDGSSSSNQEDFRERIHRKHHCKFQKNVLDALTWSSALICGWYTSQILCMRRRHLQNGWNGRCKYAQILMQPSQAFHTAVLSHSAKAAPEPISETYIWKFDESHYKFSEGVNQTNKFVYEVNNDHLKNDRNVSADPKEISPKTIDDAVHNLLQVLGDIEFQLGVESVHSNRYDLAVSHFKLATSHSHASATVT